MKRFWILRGIKFAFLGVIFAIAFTYVVMSLWNWLIPSIFGLGTINFWQALGLLILSKILFGGFRGRGGWNRSNWRHRMRERYEKMSPEEREKLREKYGQWCYPGKWEKEKGEGTEAAGTQAGTKA